MVAVAAVGPGLLPGRTPLPLDLLRLFLPWSDVGPPPANPLLGDVVLHAADRVVIARAWRSGHLPLWAPEIMAGHPMVGDSSMQPFFPLHVLPALLFDFHTAFAVQLVLQLWLAGLAMVAWVRQLTRGWLPSVVAALVWMFASYQQVWRAYPQFLGTLMWLPAVAASWEWAVRSGRQRARLAGAAAAAMAILGGQVQFVAFGASALGLYVIGRLRSLDARRRRRGLHAVLTIAVLGVALGAIGWLPVVALARDSIRPPFAPSALVATGLPARHLVTAVDPWFLGDPRDGSYRGAQNANELALYIGLMPLLLAVAAPFARRDRVTWLLAGLAVVLMVVTLGASPARALAAVPFIRQFGLMRWLALWPLVAAPLAALALDACTGDGGGRGVAGRRLRVAVVTVASGLAAVLVAQTVADGHAVGEAGVVLAWLVLSAAVLIGWTIRPQQRLFQLALLSTVIVDVGTFARGYTPDAPRADHFPLLAPIDSVMRAVATAPGRVAVLQPETKIVLGPQVAPMVSLAEIGGYASAVRASHRTFLTRLSDRSNNPYLAQNANMLTLAGLRPTLAALLNVRYVLAAEPLRDLERLAAEGGACRARVDLRGGQRLAAPFTSDADGLNRIDVAVSPGGADDGGAVAVHLFESGAADDHLAYAELSAANVPETGRDAVGRDGVSDAAPVVWRTAYFQPLGGSRGRDYVVAVDAPAAARSASAWACADGNRPVFRAWGTAAPLPASPIASGHGMTAYRADAALGRAWWVPEAVSVTHQSLALDLVTAPGFDPAAFVVVETAGGHASLAASGTPRSRRPRPAPRVAVRDDGPNRLVAQLTGVRDAGWVVWSEPYAPGWRARVDGRPAGVARADGGVRAVAVPRGGRVVEMWYSPSSVRWAAALTVLGVAWIAISAIRGLRSRRVDAED